MRTFIIFLLIISTTQKISAAYEVNNNCKEAWMLLMDLDIKGAKNVLSQELITNPENYYAHYLDQTCDAYLLLLNTSDEEYFSFLKEHERRRSIMDNKDTHSPYYLSCEAEMNLQAGIFKIVKGSKFSGLRNAYSAYNKTYENLKLHPNFKASLKLDGFFNVAIANLPPFVKWAISAFGVSGNTEYGFEILNSNYQSQKEIKGLNAESALFIILSAKLNKTPEIVYDFVNSLDTNISQTFIHTYFRSNISYRIGKNEEALNTLKSIDINTKSQGNIIYNYLMGKILLRKLDKNAEYYLSKYLSNSAKEEYLKEINYKLSLHYLINGDKQKFKNHKSATLEYGNDVNERDREAVYDAKLDFNPDVNLLKARLLLEGGYLKQYHIAIEAYENNKNNFMPFQLEYLLLKGKSDELSENYTQAIEYFKLLIAKGSNENYYFASEAALRLGKIYEKLNKKEEAKKYYNESLKLYKNNYYEYIEDKASKALTRL
jgi:hypothetical protein